MPEDESAKNREADDQTDDIIQRQDNGSIERAVGLDMDEKGRSQQNCRKNDPNEGQPIYFGGQIGYRFFGLQHLVEF